MEAETPPARTWDYTARTWGHNYEVMNIVEGGRQLKLAGWGPTPGQLRTDPRYPDEKTFPHRKIEVGDFLLLANGTDNTRYRVAAIRYCFDPPDMWFADADFAPRPTEEC